MSTRSPFELRARKPSQISSITKAENKENQLTKTITSTIKQKPAPKLSMSQPKTIDIAVQLIEINRKIAEQQSVFNDAIQLIRKEFDEKSTRFSSCIDSLRAEIDTFKTSQCKCNSTALQPLWREPTSNVMMNFILQQMGINQVEEQYQHQIEQMQNQIDAIKESITKSTSMNDNNKCEDEDECECEFKLFNDDVICQIHRDANQNSGQITTTKNSNIGETITFLQEQIDHMCLVNRTNDDEVRKGIQQINLLSSKFTEFDIKLNAHFSKFNHQNTQYIKANNIEAHKNMKNNCFSFQNSAANRFIGKYNRYTHSDTLKVRIEFATVYNENKFVKEFKKKFEQRSGKGSINNITIMHCKRENDVTHQIDVKITFNTSLSYCYLNDIRFPTNWIFFDRKNINTRAKYPVKRHHMPPE